MAEKYDRTNPKSIERYGKKLEGKHFRDFVAPAASYNPKERTSANVFAESTSYYAKSNKGGPGMWVEQYWFGYKPNSFKGADFNEAGVELKVTPFKKTRNGYSAKERLVITLINYMEDADTPFEQSHLISKLSLILLVYYLWEPDISALDYEIRYVQLLQIPEEDMPTIRHDYEVILEKINTGRAHELSEADTFYLAACTKGKDASSMRIQPYSALKAKQRAFCLKTSYMTHLLNKWIIPGKMTYEPILKDKTDVPFEEYVVDAISKYKGWTIDELCEHFSMNSRSKSRTANIAFRILGLKGNYAEEFIKAGIRLKTIRISKNGTIKESMSFPRFSFEKVAAETWEEDDFAESLRTTKYFFVVYRFGPDDKTLYLNGCQFWNMPIADIDSHVYEVWKKTKQVLNDGTCMIENGESRIYNFPKMSDDPVCHVRPHAKNAADTDILPDGRQCPKQCFWLNAKYILAQLNDEVRSVPTA